LKKSIDISVILGETQILLAAVHCWCLDVLSSRLTSLLATLRQNCKPRFLLWHGWTQTILI